MCADTRRIAAIAAAGLALREAVGQLAPVDSYEGSVVYRAVVAFDAAIAAAVGEGDGEQ